jgi:hypothetical protein
VFKEAYDFSSECGHFVDKMDQARTHKRELYLLRRKPYYTPTIFVTNSLFKSFETVSAQEMKELKKFPFREIVNLRKAPSESFEDFRENICFPGSFCTIVCTTGLNARTAV